MKKSAITLSQACDGLVRYKSAVGMSPNTVRNYRVTFAKLQAFVDDDPPFPAITRDQLISFFAYLRDDYISEPDGIANRGQIKLSAKTILNIHTDLSALWTWGVEEGYVKTNLVRTIQPPDAKPPVVETLSKDDLEKLLGACAVTRSWKSRDYKPQERPTADRDRAIILLLVDTGLRALGAVRDQDRRREPECEQHQGAGQGQQGTPRLLRQADVEGAVEAADPAAEGGRTGRLRIHRGAGG